MPAQTGLRPVHAPPLASYRPSALPAGAPQVPSAAAGADAPEALAAACLDALERRIRPTSALVRGPTPAALAQPSWLRQSAAAIARDRLQLDGAKRAATVSSLRIAGQDVPVPFPVVSYLHPRGLSYAQPARWADWLPRAALAPGQFLRHVWSSKGLGLYRESARWQAFWRQGTFGICHVPRADPSGANVNKVVLHWDACNSSAQCLRALQGGGLSAHLLLDSDGTVYQTLDLAHTKAYHAGWANERAIGIEINNPVDPAVNDVQTRRRPLVDITLPHLGQSAQHLDFLPEQKVAVAQVLDVLTQHFGIPRQLAANDVPGNITLIDDSFSGICGHYHVGTHKSDPGFTLWPYLQRHWNISSAESAAT